MTATVTASPTFQTSVPRVLFEAPLAYMTSERNYDVAQDGRFVMIEAEASEVASTEIYLATNWASELARLVP